MNNGTHTTLHHAGPANWRHLIAPTKPSPLSAGALQAASLSMDAATSAPSGIEAIFALTELAATAITLSNAIANATHATSARATFKKALQAATLLDSINKNTPPFTPTFRTYRHFKQAAETRAPQVLSSLLVDVIRIANHITN